MTKKGIGYLVSSAFGILIVGFYLISTGTNSDSPAIQDKQPAPANNEVRQPDSATAARQSGSRATGTEETARSTQEEPAGGNVTVSKEIPILGQFVRVQEIRGTGENAGSIRNLQFVFRPGILPRQLFENNNQAILKYEQLHRNMVGSGAATAFFYYEIVKNDTNGDGQLSAEDKLTVALSRPDGGSYHVLATNIDEVVKYEDLPGENALRLVMKKDGEEITRTFSLADK